MTALTFRIRADKSGPAPAGGEPWPVRGVEIEGDLTGEVLLPTSFVERHRDAAWLVAYDIGIVERPSLPDPDVDDSGSLVVAEAHRMPSPGQPAPHVFRHVDKFVIDTLNLGEVILRVVNQPDKYVDSDDPTEKVTLEAYAEGRTRVDHFYVCTLEG